MACTIQNFKVNDPLNCKTIFVGIITVEYYTSYVCLTQINHNKNYGYRYTSAVTYIDLSIRVTSICTFDSFPFEIQQK